MKKILSVLLTVMLLIGMTGVSSFCASAATSDMFFDLAFNVSQSGHIEHGATNYYKFTLKSYTTLVIDYDSTDEELRSGISGYFYVFKVSDWDNKEFGNEYKKYFSASVTKGNNGCTRYDGKMSLYAGTYYLAIVPNHENSWGNYTPGSNNYTLSVCPTVIKLTKADFTATTSAVSVTWRGDLGASSYQIQRKVNGQYKTLKNTTSTSYYESNLKSGTQYDYRVRGCVELGGKKYYGEWRYVSALTKPAAPTAKAPATNNKHQITAKWNAVKPASGYQIQYSLKKNFSSSVVTKTVDGQSKTSNTVNKMTKGKTYYVRVRSYKVWNGKKYYSAWSAVKSVKCK